MDPDHNTGKSYFTYIFGISYRHDSWFHELTTLFTGTPYKKYKKTYLYLVFNATNLMVFKGELDLSQG
jgi:hypothetical protein